MECGSIHLLAKAQQARTESASAKRQGGARETRWTARRTQGPSPQTPARGNTKLSYGAGSCYFTRDGVWLRLVRPRCCKVALTPDMPPRRVLRSPLIRWCVLLYVLLVWLYAYMRCRCFHRHVLLLLCDYAIVGTCMVLADRYPRSAVLQGTEIKGALIYFNAY